MLRQEFDSLIDRKWDADIIIHDYKIAILWNGAWHYKQISKNSSLIQIQNRDVIKINEIKKGNNILVYPENK